MSFLYALEIRKDIKYIISEIKRHQDLIVSLEYFLNLELNSDIFSFSSPAVQSLHRTINWHKIQINILKSHLLRQRKVLEKLIC